MCGRSALTHFVSTFEPGMGRSDRVWLFGSGCWIDFSHFSICADAFGLAVVEWVSSLEIALGQRPRL
jgi:hypothetical protein